MTRDEAVSQAMQSLQQSLNQSFGAAFDAGTEAASSVQGGKQFAQSDIDAAVAKVTGDDAEHMKALQSEIDTDESDMAALKAKISGMLSDALSMLSPGSDPKATQQTPGVSVDPAVGQQNNQGSVAAQKGGPLPDENSGLNTPPAVSGNGAAVGATPSPEGGESQANGPVVANN